MPTQHGMLRARTWSAREAEIRLEPGSEEAWPAARTQMYACFLHEVLPACHAMLFLMFMQHGMQHAWVAGVQDPEIGPTRASRLTSAWSTSVRRDGSVDTCRTVANVCIVVDL